VSKQFILREVVASKSYGKPLWFKQMTGIGPMTTPDPDEAARFPTEEAAARSPACLHMLSCYEIEEDPHP
jgi:hypothetical protein